MSFVHVADIKCHCHAFSVLSIEATSSDIKQVKIIRNHALHWLLVHEGPSIVFLLHCSFRTFQPKKAVVQRHLADAMSRVVVQFLGTKSFFQLAPVSCHGSIHRTESSQDILLSKCIKMYQHVIPLYRYTVPGDDVYTVVI